MILKTLRLKNFRKFKDTLIEFPDGVIGVVGLNGVGKSTIFEAIAWVLYGPVAARTSADQIKRKNADAKEPCRVELEFIFESDTYRIIRELKGKNQTASATITINQKQAATGAETVSKYIQKKLGMDFKSFFTSIFAKQKELNTLSTMNASDRRPLILKMLGIDSVDDVIKEIRSDKKNKDAVIEKLTYELSDDTGKEKTEINKEKIKNLEKEKNQIIKNITKNKEQLIKIKKQFKLEEKKYIQIKKDFQKTNNEKEKLTQKKILFENTMKLKEEITQLTKKIKERHNLIEKQNKKLKEYKNLEIEIKKTESRLDKLEEQSNNHIKNIEQKKTQVQGFEKNITEYTSKKQNIEKIGSNAKCPTCEKILGEQYRFLIDKFAKEIKQKQKEKESLLKHIKTQNEQYEKISRERLALGKKNNFLHSRFNEKQRIDTTIKNMLIEISREKKDVEIKEKQIKKIGKVLFDQKHFNALLKKIEVLQNNLDKALMIIQTKKDLHNSIEIEIVKKESDKSVIIQKIKSLNEKNKELGEFKKRIKTEKREVQNLSMLIDVMISFRTHLISRIRPTLSLYASDFFDRLTDGKYREIELDMDYNLIVYDDGTPYPIDRFSGGEEDLANLCLRLAISEVITERAGGAFNFIILDEIFGSQDNIRRQNILKALNSLSSKFRQIFLITHIEDIKNFMEYTIAISENQTGISTSKIE